MIIQQLSKRRESLGMTYDALATRAKVPASTVKRILTTSDDRASMATILAIAEALGIRVELKEIATPLEFRKQQAQKKARWLVKLVQGSSALEAQAVESQAYDEMVEQTTHELMAANPKQLWK